MIRRALTTTVLVLLAAAPLCAQNSADPDKKVQGGALPAGWTGRTDRPNAKLADANFTAMSGGYHVTSGPAAIYWNATQTTTGPFRASATFAQMKAPSHPEAYGLFFNGQKLDSPDQTYAYFIVRGDGKVMVKHRAGNEVHTVMDWTENAAVHKQDAAGKATNTLTVDASKPDAVRLLVNGVQVATYPSASPGAVGIRVNHNLDVHISDFTVTPSSTSVEMTKKEKKAAKKAAKKATKG
jgi:hypothetical protein